VHPHRKRHLSHLIPDIACTSLQFCIAPCPACAVATSGMRGHNAAERAPASGDQRRARQARPERMSTPQRCGRQRAELFTGHAWPWGSPSSRAAPRHRRGDWRLAIALLASYFGAHLASERSYASGTLGTPRGPANGRGARTQTCAPKGRPYESMRPCGARASTDTPPRRNAERLNSEMVQMI
jgi:hypothetical protein